jgi:glutamyl-tRNA synthetase
MPLEELVARVAEFLTVHGHADVADDPRLARAVDISREKMQTLADFWELCGPLLTAPADDRAARERWLGDAGREALREAREALAGLDRFDEEHVERALEGVVERRSVKAREVFQPVRVAISGTSISPGIFESVTLLGREETLRRMDAALAQT